MSPYAIASIVIVLVTLAILVWLWFSEPDDEALEELRQSARPYDTEIMNDAFDREADSTSDERKHHG